MRSTPETAGQDPSSKLNGLRVLHCTTILRQVAAPRGGLGLAHAYLPVAAIMARMRCEALGDASRGASIDANTIVQ
jgi:hypothetical protein